MAGTAPDTGLPGRGPKGGSGGDPAHRDLPAQRHGAGSHKVAPGNVCNVRRSGPSEPAGSMARLSAYRCCLRPCSYRGASVDLYRCPDPLPWHEGMLRTGRHPTLSPSWTDTPRLSAARDGTTVRHSAAHLPADLEGTQGPRTGDRPQPSHVPARGRRATGLRLAAARHCPDRGRSGLVVRPRQDVSGRPRAQPGASTQEPCRDLRSPCRAAPVPRRYRSETGSDRSRCRAGSPLPHSRGYCQ